MTQKANGPIFMVCPVRLQAVEVADSCCFSIAELTASGEAKPTDGFFPGARSSEQSRSWFEGNISSRPRSSVDERSRGRSCRSCKKDETPDEIQDFQRSRGFRHGSRSARRDTDRNKGSSHARASKTKAAPMISRQMRSLAILAALALAGCTVATLNLGATDYKGKPLSEVTAKLGQPNEVQTIAGQKAYIWNVGNTLYACKIRVVMAGDVVDTYEGSGDVNICAQYGAVSGGLKGYRE